MNIGSVEYIIKEQYHIPSLETFIIKDSIKLLQSKTIMTHSFQWLKTEVTHPLAKAENLLTYPPFTPGNPSLYFLTTP